MKKFIMLSAVLTFCFVSSVLSQVQRHDYQKIDYIRVHQSDMERFTDLSREVLKSGFQNLAESGKVKNWFLYRVSYPGGERSDYNYVSVITVRSPNIVEEIFSSPDLPQYIPGNSGRSKKLLENAEWVASELWKVENTALVEDQSKKPSPYLVMDYMKVPPGRNLDYLMLEDEIAKPIHIERIEVEKMAGWAAYSLITPGGINYEYNFSTGNQFDSLSHIEFGFTEEVINRTMNDVNVPELFNTIYSTRELVKSELWTLIDHVTEVVEE